MLVAPSYLLSLLVVRAYENATSRSMDGQLPTDRVVLGYFVKLVLSTAHHK